MELRVQLFPPLNNTAGCDWVRLSLPAPATLRSVIDALVERFGAQFRRHLYDTEERFVPAWCAFVNGKPIQLNRSEALSTELKDGDEIALLLNLAGG